MAIKVRIPTPLQTLTHGTEEIEVLAGKNSELLTVSDLIRDLDKTYLGFEEKIIEAGKIRRFINIYVKEEDIRSLQGEQTPVKDGDEITIIPAIAGGRGNSLSREQEGGTMKRRVKLTFPQHLVKEPIIFTMAKNYGVMPNIRRARVTDTVGEMILELEGTEENLEKALNALQNQGVQVQLIEGDVIE
jgi:molybdopterin synthase sulfur carrier subunit